MALPFTALAAGDGQTADPPLDRKNVYLVRLPGPYQVHDRHHRGMAAGERDVISSTRNPVVHAGYRLHTPWGVTEPFETNTPLTELEKRIKNVIGDRSVAGGVDWAVTSIGAANAPLGTTTYYDHDGYPPDPDRWAEDNPGLVTTTNHAGRVAGPGFVLHVRPYWGAGEAVFPRRAETGPIRLLQETASADIEWGADPDADPLAPDPALRAHVTAVATGRAGLAGLVEARVGADGGTSVWYPPGPNGADGTVGDGSPVTVAVGDSAAVVDAAIDAAGDWPLQCVSGVGTAADPWALTTDTLRVGRPAADDAALFGGGSGTVAALAEGLSPIDAVHRHTLAGDVTGGRIAWRREAAASVAVDALTATAAAHAAAVNAALGDGAVGFAGDPGGPWTVTFGGPLAGAPLGPLEPVTTALLSGSGTQSVRAVTLQHASGPAHWNDPLNWTVAAEGSDASRNPATRSCWKTGRIRTTTGCGSGPSSPRPRAIPSCGRPRTRQAGGSTTSAWARRSASSPPGRPPCPAACRGRPCITWSRATRTPARWPWRPPPAAPRSPRRPLAAARFGSGCGPPSWSSEACTAGPSVCPKSGTAIGWNT